MAEPGVVEGLKQLGSDLYNQPSKPLGQLWESYQSAAPGLGIPGGGVPGAMTSAAGAYAPRIMQLLSQMSKVSQPQFGQGAQMNILKGPAAHYLEEEGPKIAKYMQEGGGKAGKFFWDVMNPTGKLGRASGLTFPPRGNGAIITLLSENAKNPVPVAPRTVFHEALHQLLLHKNPGDPKHGGFFSPERTKQIYDFYAARDPFVKKYAEVAEALGNSKLVAMQEAAIEALARNMTTRIKK